MKYSSEIGASNLMNSYLTALIGPKSSELSVD